MDFLDLRAIRSQLRRTSSYGRACPAMAIDEVAGDTVEMGPMAAGPGGIAQVKALGKTRPARVERPSGQVIRYVATLPIDLDLEVKLAGVRTVTTGLVAVRLVLTVRTAEPLLLVIHVGEITHEDVDVELRPSNVAAGMLQTVGNLDDEVRRNVARVVNAADLGAQSGRHEGDRHRRDGRQGLVARPSTSRRGN